MRAALKTHGRSAAPVSNQDVTAKSFTQSTLILEVLQQKHVSVHALAILKFRLGSFS